MGTEQNSFIRNAATLTSICIVLSGCLMGEEDSKSSGKVIADNALSGSVGDGPVVGASMRVLRNDGVELGQVASDSNANYNITVRTFSEFYPLTIEARGGTDIVTNSTPDFQLLGAVFETNAASVANVNPFSTFAVELARDLPGGADMANLQTAQRIVTDELNNGLTSLAVSGVMTTSIDGSNVAEVIRASEALGETVRRTRNALNSSGFSMLGDDVVRALSSDLTNSVIDGDGGPRTDARTAAVAVIVSAQVLLETMANELHVNGANATQLMSNAIDQVSVGTADPTLEQLTVTGEMLSHARVGLVAAHAVTGDSAIAELLTALNGVQEGSSSSTVLSFALPSDYRSRLDAAILLVASGSGAIVGTVNNISHDRTQAISAENRAPTISGTPAGFVIAGSAYSFTPGVFDVDGDALTFNITNLPIWASFNASTGQLTGTPNESHVGTYPNIGISVSDGFRSTSLAPFSINVRAQNSAPQISGSAPANANVGENYFFIPTASDPDGDALSFSVSGLPSWASFRTFNGRIRGTPQAGDVGTYSNISITVSDGQASASLGPFTITVNGVVSNSAPQIFGSAPADVNVGQNYSFTPTANDPDGDTLSFTVSGLPSWASFSNSTGRISGTPQSGDVGPYSNISITVSDGQATASLGPFTITVQAISLGSVTLDWTAPTQNEDGSPLTDLDGYRLYWGTTSGNYPNSVTIDNETVTTYVVDNLTSGTYEFVATSFNTAGMESAYSSPLAKVVP